MATTKISVSRKSSKSSSSKKRPSVSARSLSARKPAAKLGSRTRSASRSMTRSAPMKEVRQMGHDVVSSIKSVLPSSFKGASSTRRKKSAAGRKGAIASNVSPLRASARTRSARSTRARRAA